jgi:SAM-dependent methyltransferase
MGLLRWLGDTARRAGVVKLNLTDKPDRGLVELIEGEAAPSIPAGRALDLGCASGRNTLYLARHGWEVTGVEIAANDLDLARRKALESGLEPTLVQGDVTRLDELGIGDGFTLLYDGGCLHMIPRHRRDAYARGVTSVAAPGAILVLVGFGRHPTGEIGVTADELRERLSGWKLVDVEAVSGEEMTETLAGKARLARTALRRGWLRASRYRLERN